ncbi:MAG: hypothetical protein R6V85_06145 [Polyangia bacterium]
MSCDYDKRRLIQWLRAEMTRAAGRAYPRLDLEALDIDSLRELQRLLRDLDAERRMAVQLARMTPWRIA